MPLQPILRLLLAGLMAGSALLAPVPWPLDPPSAFADGPGDWPMFRHDPAHNGYNPNETSLKPPLRLKWSFTTGAEVTSSPAAANGVLNVRSLDGKVYAPEAATGGLRWSYDTHGAVGCPCPAWWTR